ncbi:MAG: DUF3343 domain-containing protein [Synergistales bacterium]|nr:DUF3343 domain-containing protein [Synergistales bacterium]
MFGIATFDSNHMVMQFQKVCEEAGIEVNVIPVPRELAASCGLACFYPKGEEERIKRLMAEHNVEVHAYH